jgi:phosphoribosylaminoimidazole-succinocarboxamide synthase
MKMEEVILKTDLEGIKPLFQGKVRDIYDLGDKLLIIATDRISAFDSILPTGIPYKGKVLNLLSAYWFNYTRDVIENHMITSEVREFPVQLRDYHELLKGRSMLVKKARRIDIECVVRGYLAGSAWDEYQRKGSVCGIALPNGLKESDRLHEPIFTPAIKAATGHDVNISEEKTAELVGEHLKDELREYSLNVYEKAFKKAKSEGIILADSKFEFGIFDNRLILIDELLTPDSSRFWSLEEYHPGMPQKSFDKQFVRDYLINIRWDKEPPAPPLPEHIVQKTTQKYLEAYKRITGEELI